MKKILATGIAVFLLTLSASIASANDGNEGMIRMAGTTLNVRSSAGVANNLIGYLNTFDKVTVWSKSSDGAWCKISFKNSTAWVACRYLMKEVNHEDKKDHDKNDNRKDGMTVTSALNVRSTPAVADNRIGYLNIGDRVWVKEKSSNGLWCKIDFNGREAWIACAYLKG
ncbi:MAG: SH3 domain-containing protein [Candidatus Gracilibacteria bacterium]